MITKIKQFLCGLFGGHYYMIRFHPKRVDLVCSDCNHVTEGWDLD